MLYLVLVYERSEAVSFVVRVEREGPPLPAAVHAVSAEEVVQAGHKRPGDFAQVDRVQFQVGLGNHVLEGPQQLV